MACYPISRPLSIWEAIKKHLYIQYIPPASPLKLQSTMIYIYIYIFLSLRVIFSMWKHKTFRKIMQWWIPQSLSNHVGSIKVCRSLGLQGIPSYFSKRGHHSFLIFFEPSGFFWLNGSMIFTRLSSRTIIISWNTSYKSKNWSLFFGLTKRLVTKFLRPESG